MIVCKLRQNRSAAQASLDLLLRFRNSKIFRDGFVSLSLNPQPEGTGTQFLLAPYPLTCLAWVALPGGYTAASIALRIIGIRKPLDGKATILKEVRGSEDN
jgi:hypothetical protein